MSYWLWRKTLRLRFWLGLRCQRWVAYLHSDVPFCKARVGWKVTFMALVGNNDYIHCLEVSEEND